MLITDNFCRERRTRHRIEDDSTKHVAVALFAGTKSERRVIRQNGIDADEDSIGTLTQVHAVGARLLASDPFGFARDSGNLAIERHRGFHGDERRAMNHPMIEPFIERGAFVSEHSGDNLLVCAAQNFEGAPGMFWVGVGSANDDALDAGGLDGLGAGRGAAMGATGFQRDVERRAAWIVAVALRIVQGFDLPMRQAGPMMRLPLTSTAPTMGLGEVVP